MDNHSLDHLQPDNRLPPIFSHVEPVLAVHDLTETTFYWQDVLGFSGKWTWGDPPNHGGVTWQKVFIQFSQNPELATVSKGNSIWIRVRRIETLYDFHKQKNAEIVSALKIQPWGMAEYVVREINGYFIHFSCPASDWKKTNTKEQPHAIQIKERLPSLEEFRSLASAVGWSISTDDVLVRKSLKTALFSVVAEDVKGEIVGCAFLLGDDATFYYVKDLIVHPDWQGKRIGTVLMKKLDQWLDKNGVENALVALISGETLEPFYQQFGFAQAFSMIKYINKDKK